MNETERTVHDSNHPEREKPVGMFSVNSVRFHVRIFSAAMVLALACGVSTQEHDALKSAAEALGVNHIKALQFTASGATFTVGRISPRAIHGRESHSSAIRL